MTRLITTDDIIDTYSKIRQRGLSFVSGKFNLDASKRTKSAFNELNIESANWWIIPRIQQRWNKLITGNESLGYEKFVVENFIGNQDNIKMLSLGSGVCKHELEFASYSQFEKITCIDISDLLLDEAAQVANDRGLKNIEFIAQNIYDFELPDNEFDFVLFNASLHHFKNIEEFLTKKISKTLKPNGKLIINEYVGKNRLQFPSQQIKAINDALKLIPIKFKKRYKLSFKKTKFSGSGILRMFVADPSECVESENILPVIHANFKTVYEASYGGNILMNCLKDIAHNFLGTDPESDEVLTKLFEFEDGYLQDNPSDFVFGIYESSINKANNNPNNSIDR